MNSEMVEYKNLKPGDLIGIETFILEMIISVKQLHSDKVCVQVLNIKDRMQKQNEGKIISYRVNSHFKVRVVLNNENKTS